MSDEPAKAPISLGLGLLSIGRAWGYRTGEPPSEREAIDLLRHAVARGIRFFDTAPAYGSSERIFGRFLRDWGAESQSAVISTKMGEHWEPGSGSSFTDHSYDALCRSLDRSLELLGRIDLLQIHKATPEVLASKDVARTVNYARSAGIEAIGASVSDLAAARIACDAGQYSHIQFPYNRLSTALEPAFEMARQAGIAVIVNRPFAMGQIIHDAQDGQACPLRSALSFIVRKSFSGFILTGTRSRQHLDESISAFQSVI